MAQSNKQDSQGDLLLLVMSSFFHPVALKLARLQLKNAWRHFFVFIVCLVLGVSVITTVNLFSNLTRNTLTNESKSLLGGDLEVTSRNTIAPEIRDFLTNYGNTSFVTTTQAMLVSESQKRLLVSIKAVDEPYPLFGEFKVQSDQEPDKLLNEKNIIVDGALLAQLGLNLMDEVKIGNGIFKIVDTIKLEPDRVVQTLNFGPRVIMSHSALNQSALTTGLSLKRDRLRIALFDEYTEENFKERLQLILDEKFNNFSLRVRDENNRSDNVSEFIDKLTGFLNLLGLGVFLIAGIGIASSTRAYLAKTYQTVAILKVQGANQSIILQTYSLIIGSLATLSALIGIILSFIIFYGTMPLVANMMPILQDKQNFDFISPLLALWYSLLVAFLFSIPSLMNLHKMKAASFFRQKIYTFNAPIDKKSLAWIILFSLVLVASMSLSSNDSIFMLISILVMTVSLFIFIALASLARIIAWQFKAKSLWLSLALANISDNKSNIYIFILAIGMSLSILLTLNLTEANFNKQIQMRSQSQIPDLFMIDIQPNQKENLENLLNSMSVTDYDILPLVRGRISHIKGIAVENLTIPEEIDWALNRDRGISYSDLAPKNARISRGSWWSSDYAGEPLASVDERLLTEMDLNIGDKITIQILNQSFDVKIASARAVDYASFQINFFLMLSPNAISKFPHSLISTVNLTSSNNADIDLSNRGQTVAKISETFPNVSIVQTEEVISLIQRLIDNVAIALKIMATLSIFAGFLILSSVLSANIQDRFFETAIFKALGANWKHIIKVHLAEWLILSTITCLVAILVGLTGAYLVDFYFANEFSELDFYISPQVIFYLCLMTFAIVLTIGYLGLRKIFKIRISSLLRND